MNSHFSLTEQHFQSPSNCIPIGGKNEDYKSVSLFLNLKEASVLLGNGGFI